MADSIRSSALAFSGEVSSNSERACRALRIQHLMLPVRRERTHVCPEVTVLRGESTERVRIGLCACHIHNLFELTLSK
jgi:hypothetical protein